MYIQGGSRISAVIWNDRHALVILVFLSIGTELLEPYLPQSDLFSPMYVGILATALSIFLVFRFNEAYERWWEARKLWGYLVNLSRDFARQTLTMLGDRAQRSLVDQLVHSQIAFVHALRVRLRDGNSSAGRARLELELRRLVPDEADELMQLDNVPLAILHRQSERVASRLQGSVADAVVLSRFDRTLRDLMDAGGGCERIKSTVFPDTVAVVTRSMVWGLVLLLYLATLEPDGRGGIVASVAVGAMAMGFIWIDSIGRDLKDPFENHPNDTPMSSICVGIERDLREMLGETELPDPVLPKRGVLM